MKHLSWVYLLIFFICILILNIYLTNEGFYSKNLNPFTDYILSLITIDPDSDYKCYSSTDSSGNKVPTKPSAPSKPSTPSVPSKPSTPSVPSKPSDSSTDYDDDVARTTNKIVKQLRNEIDEEIRNQKIQSRHEPINVTVTAPPAPSCPSVSIVPDPTPSPSLEQGKECIQSNPVTDCQRKDPSALDMSEYIRKDSIPCWGCSGL